VFQVERYRHAAVVTLPIALPVASSCDRLAGLLAVPSGQGVLAVNLVFVFLVLNIVYLWFLRLHTIAFPAASVDWY
jgi:hypothetical protein